MHKSSLNIVFAIIVVIVSVIAPERSTHLSASSAGSSAILISALHYYGYEGNADEAVQLANTSTQTVVLDSHYAISDEGNRKLSFSTPLTMTAKSRAWIARDATAFARSFGYAPTLTYDQMSGSKLIFANDGGFAKLTRDGATLDTLVYGNASATDGWQGAALQPYVVTGTIPANGQILMRQLDLRDSDTAQDWLNDRADKVNGRRPIYPGWQYEGFSQPAVASAPITLVLTPDGGYDVLMAALATAQHSIDIETYSFENARVADALRAKIESGVRVRMLLEGAPVGGITDQQRWTCMQISSTRADSGCWFMRAGGQSPHTRYKFMHSKFIIIDGVTLLVGSENLGPNSYPDDDKGDGTLGQRGVLTMFQSPTLIQRAQDIFDADYNLSMSDITRWCDALSCMPYGTPSSGFQPSYVTGGTGYPSLLGQPLRVQTPVTIEMATSPESNLRGDGGLLALLNQAGAGDEILVEQLSEATYWGPTSSNPTNDPNLRLQAVIDAAARGASIRMLLDSFYLADDAAEAPRNNLKTVQLLLSMAQANGWDVRAAVGDPTLHGIHNKMYLARVQGRKYAQIGSWNGSEVSSKTDREMTLLIESAEVFDFLRDMWIRDYGLAHPIYLPVVLNQFSPPPTLDHLLISEVMFDVIGTDEGREWIEIYNPTANPISLSGVKVGDAETVGRTIGDGMFAFPSGASVPAFGVIVVAQNAPMYFADHGRKPDYEIGSYDPTVPDLTPYTAWSNGTISLSNTGDQVLLLDSGDNMSDAVQWGVSTLTSVAPFTLPVTSGYSLQRSPPDQDTNDCAKDFRAQPSPNPGVVP